MILGAKKVCGLRVYLLENSQRHGKIAALTYDPKELKIKSLLVKKDGSAEDMEVIIFRDIILFGLDAVIVKSKKQLTKIKDIREDLGKILKDWATSFDSKTGKIELISAPKYFSEVKNK